MPPCSLLAAPAPRRPGAIAGEWWTPGFNARVRIEPCGDAVCGRIVWLWDDKPKGIADKSPLIGRTVIDRMRRGRGQPLARWPPVQPGGRARLQGLAAAAVAVDGWSSTAACCSSARRRCGAAPIRNAARPWRHEPPGRSEGEYRSAQREGCPNEAPQLRVTGRPAACHSLMPSIVLLAR